MKIINSYPPNIKLIRQAFPGAPLERAIYAWGDIIYAPNDGRVTEDLVVHEATHGRQQQLCASIEEWWKRYLSDKEFRLTQEIEAYQAQYQYVRANHSRQVTKDFLKKLAKDCSGPLYGRMCSFEYAKEKICNQ